MMKHIMLSQERALSCTLGQYREIISKHTEKKVSQKYSQEIGNKVNTRN